MASADSAGQAHQPNHDDIPTDRPTRRANRDRHGRHEPTQPAVARQAGPRGNTGSGFTIAPPKTTPMTPQEYERAVRAWAVLIASWWTEHPPDQAND
jgi:hypothetical protein